MFAARLTSSFARRSFSSSIVRKDLIQDLYIKELKAYKAPEADKSAQLAAVKSFTPPSAPAAPASLTADLATDLKTYDATAVDLASASSKSTAEEVVEGTKNIDALFEELKRDLPPATAH